MTAHVAGTSSQSPIAAMDLPTLPPSPRASAAATASTVAVDGFDAASAGAAPRPSREATVAQRRLEMARGEEKIVQSKLNSLTFWSKLTNGVVGVGLAAAVLAVPILNLGAVFIVPATFLALAGFILVADLSARCTALQDRLSHVGGGVKMAEDIVGELETAAQSPRAPQRLVDGLAVPTPPTR